MNFGVPLVFMVLASILRAHEFARICLSCTNLAENDRCQHVTYCDNNEVCFVQKYMTLRNETRYDVGCTYPELCRKDMTGSIIGKRNDYAHVICQRCCSDKGVCNTDLTCDYNLIVPRQKCLTCGTIESPELCQTTTICEKDELCFLQKYLTEDTQEHFDMGCKHSTLCLHGFSTNVFGRRLSNGRNLVCESCCGGIENCNSNLHCSHDNGTTENGACTTTQQCMSNLQCYSNVCSCDIAKYWNGTTCLSKKSFKGDCKETQECINTLFCNHGQCRCGELDYWTGSLCSLRKSYNSSCSSTQECTVSLQCIQKKCTCMSSEYWTGTECLLKSKECMGIDSNHDGIYTIHPNDQDPVQVYCIMDGENKWTVIQRRTNGSVRFNRTWSEYKLGFGSISEEYWLGNDNIYLISSNGNHEISFYLEESKQKFGYANYSTFSMGDEQSKYVLTISGYSGSTNDGMDKTNLTGRGLNGQNFSTFDQDNDPDTGNCADVYGGGWWYNKCYAANLNTLVMYWYPYSEHLMKSIMMIRHTS